MAIWVCRTGSDGRYDELFLETSCIYLTRENLNFNIKSVDKNYILNHLLSQNPSAARQTISNIWSQLDIFANRMQINDVVIIPKKGKYCINVAVVEGEYEYHNNAVFPETHRRKIRIIAKNVDTNKFPRDLFYSLGAFRTIFEIKDSVKMVNELIKRGIDVNK